MTGLTMDEWTARLLASAIADEVLDLGPGNADGAALLVPAAAVRAAVLDPSYAESIRGLRLRGARIDGDLDLAEATIPRPLALVDSLVDAVDLQWARTRTIDLTGSYVGRIRLDWATVDGGVLAGELRTAGPFRALSAKVAGPLVLSGARLANDDAGSTVCLDGAEVPCRGPGVRRGVPGARREAAQPARPHRLPPQQPRRRRAQSPAGRDRRWHLRGRPAGHGADQPVEHAGGRWAAPQ